MYPHSAYIRITSHDCLTFSEVIQMDILKINNYLEANLNKVY